MGLRLKRPERLCKGNTHQVVETEMKGFLLRTLLTTLFVFSVVESVRAESISKGELVRRTQQLLDAFAPGNKAPWDLYLAADAILFDEMGRSMDKRAFLDQLQALPDGYSGSIELKNAKARLIGCAAILSYDADETETIFGQELHARYHMTDTWAYRNARWQIIASQTLRYYEDPAVGTVSESALNDYVGRYELAPGSTKMVTRRDGKLYVQRGDGQPVELHAESPDLFFRSGVEGRYLFHRDPSGRVDLLIDRRNNEDLRWRRIG
jgi:hypothetical protein